MITWKHFAREDSPDGEVNSATPRAHAQVIKRLLERRIEAAAIALREQWDRAETAKAPLRKYPLYRNWKHPEWWFRHERAELRDAQDQYAKFCRRRGLEPWA